MTLMDRHETAAEDEAGEKDCMCMKHMMKH